jgi:hypothetical protein
MVSQGSLQCGTSTRQRSAPLILQPGPAALTDGLDALAAIVTEWAACHASGVYS